MYISRICLLGMMLLLQEIIVSTYVEFFLSALVISLEKFRVLNLDIIKYLLSPPIIVHVWMPHISRLFVEPFPSSRYLLDHA